MAFGVKFQTVVVKKGIVNTQEMLRAVQRTQNLVAGQVIRRGQQYPAERPNQKYIRTFKLKESWRVVPSRQSGDRFVCDVVNDATDTKRKTPKKYAGYVFGTNDAGRGQSVYHVGRWPTVGQLANRESYRQQVQNAVNKVK